MSLIANCLNRLVRSGQITQKAGKAALDIHEGLQGHLSGRMPITHADAAAALEAARIMGEAAKRHRRTVVMNAMGENRTAERQNAHPRGKQAGLMSLLVPEVRETTIGERIGFLRWGKRVPIIRGLNVESHAEDIENQLLGIANDLLEPYRSKAGGLIRDAIVGPKNVVRESFGKDTGDPSAKAAWKSFEGATNKGIEYAEKAGITFRSQVEKAMWRLPQFWESSRVARFGKKAFMDAIDDAWRAGGLKIIDKRTGEVASDLDRINIVQEAYDHIVANESLSAHGSAFNDSMRVFRFENAESWIKLMDQYGPGEAGIFGMMVSHLKGMSHEIAMSDVFGPSYQVNFSRRLKAAKVESREMGKLAKVSPLRPFESAAAAERTFKMLTGELNSVENDLIAGIGGSMRNIATAAKLGSAIITAVPGDSVTAGMAARYNGISATRMLARYAEGVAREGPEIRAQAARMQVVAHAVIDGMHSARRYGDQMELSNRFGQLAGFVIRASGLNFHTANLKRAFSMEFLAHIAEESGKGLDELDPAFRGFLTRYGFGAAEWDTIRATAPLEVEGAKFFDGEAMTDKALRDRLMSAIIDERRHAVLESTARVRQFTTGGMRRGTFWGDIVVRGAAMFKSFGMSMVLTHGMRAMTGPGNLAKRGLDLGLKLMVPMTIAGAVSLQAKSLLSGKDPRDMSDPAFWFDAFVTGGGSGIYGDLLKIAETGGPQADLYALITGPPGEIAKTGKELTYDQVFKLYNGDKTNFGATLAKFVKNNTPGSTLFYTRVAMDRLIFDQIQSWADPNYLGSFRRQEKRLRENTNQSFWWRPGKISPDRPPDFGAMVP